MRYFCIGLTVTTMAAPVAAGDLARVSPFTAATFGNVPCAAEMPILVTAPAPESFSDDVPALIALAAEAGRVLGGKCPALERIEIDGEAGFTSVFQGSAAKADNWQIDVLRSFDASRTVTASMQSQIRQSAGGGGPAGGQTPPANPFAAFDPLKNQSTPSQGGAAGTTPPPAPPPVRGTFDASGFQRPDLIAAFYDGDMATLGADKEATLFYLMPIVSQFNAPDVWFRIGLDAELLMDPELMPILNGIGMTDPDFMRSVTEPGLSGILGAILGMAEERKRNIDSNTFDPYSEMAGFNRGMLEHTTPMARSIASAKYDAKRLLHLATVDQAAFLRVYDGIRKFVYAY